MNGKDQYIVGNRVQWRDPMAVHDKDKMGAIIKVDHEHGQITIKLDGTADGASGLVARFRNGRWMFNCGDLRHQKWSHVSPCRK